jgi:uncharacterized repeat protein (TIGR04076 family)
LEIEVYAVRGKCPVHKVEDRIVIDDPKIVLRETDALCTHALSSLLHYVLALEERSDPVKLGLSKPDDREHAYIQCVDPGRPYITEQLIGLVEKGARIGEVPISYRKRVGETKLVLWKDGLRIIRSILKNLKEHAGRVALY